MILVAGNEQNLEIVSPMTWGKRALFALLAFFPLLAPYELMLRIQWTDFLHPFFLLSAFISAGATALSLFLFFAAAAGLSSRITLDASQASCTYTDAAPVIRRRTRVFPLSSIQSVNIETHEWSDGAPSYSLKFVFTGKDAVEIGSTWSRDEIQQIKTQVEAFLSQAQSFRLS